MAVDCSDNVVRGVDVIIEVEDSSGQTVPIGYQRGGSLSRQADTLDLTSKDNFGWSDSDYGVRSWSIDCDGVFVENNEGLDLLTQAFNDRACVRVQIKYPSGTTMGGTAIITSFPIDVPYDDVATYSLSLQGRGELEMTKGAAVLAAKVSAKPKSETK